jgi:poly-gamma-glutamate synthesis protein (capsule biosynthesis protein)
VNAKRPNGDGVGTGPSAIRLSRREILRAGLALPALALPFLASCSDESRNRERTYRLPTGSSSSATTETTNPTTSGVRGPLGNGQSVTFAFAGDTHFVDRWDSEGGANYAGIPVLADQLKGDPLHLLAPIAPLLSSADLAMVNLETAITERGEPVAGKAFHFRSPAESFRALEAAGVDVVTMANNHALDYGPVGMADTFDAIVSSRVAVVGIGHNAHEAYRPYRSVINGQRVAIFGAVDWLEPALVPAWTATANQPGLAFSIDRRPLLAAVAAVRPEVDTLIVFMHWGVEQTHCASSEQSSLTQSLLSAGADIIVGSHAHRVFGAGHIGGAFVAYGLGNFVYWREDGESGSSGVLLVKATGRHVDHYSWIPARITHGVPVPEHGATASLDLNTWTQRRTCSGLSP